MKCYKTAATAVERQAEVGYYDQNGIATAECAPAPNRRAWICSVAAYKGDGAAADTYRVVLNSSCTRAYRVELIGEE